MTEITTNEIDYASVVEQARSVHAGAVCLFLGTVREFTEGRQTRWLEYEAYPEMAAKKMAELETQARDRWPLSEVVVHHRVGRLNLGEIAVAVAVSSPHRAAAFEACQWLMDSIKETVPIWKQERYVDGAVQWIHPGADSPSDPPASS
jgi:molybdopterin synthase catalytic subunit